MNQPTHHDTQVVYHARRTRKQRSWVSFILTLIAMVLTAIAAYSMYRDPLFTSHLLNQDVNYHQFQQFTQQLSSQAFVDLSNFEEELSRLLWIINLFYILCFVNIVLAILTLVFNRTLLKIFNFLISLVVFFIPVGLLFIIRNAATQLSESLAPLEAIIGNIEATSLLAESNAVHNAIIFTGIAAFLYLISLFFRNRKVGMRL
ncbi:MULTISPECIES: hypothetical protein [unclassified Staphylococcus]|uniref:hypothetical protein n=1 Tax=unclassified Staphylococcus TaxID=91994 RepID=UPI0021D39AAE|nr:MULTISPECIES: hypothetical protein [unclassified Staphylococcus]UXR69361.1 hypothetical protein MUA26_09595 [Staphylococcus sp. IVB6246]UXR71416.1 hypothetical protein MUA88_09615 [Staphylococcus sp. IVB6240]UXR73695.1 hypothetical protein MUA48_10120 [Staphylococcus sp. IVB6238]UXR76013.1 hypothetical protein MUA74_10210 [Staphylococcus sp. IVB6233]UXR80210.1 hypothetical protein MUA65_09815 [Staphylococcus sp. IVB6218]